LHCKLGGVCAGYDQQDAHEFLIALLDGVDSHIVKYHHTHHSSDMDEDVGDDSEDDVSSDGAKSHIAQQLLTGTEVNNAPKAEVNIQSVAVTGKTVVPLPSYSTSQSINGMQTIQGLQPLINVSAVMGQNNFKPPPATHHRSSHFTFDDDSLQLDSIVDAFIEELNGESEDFPRTQPHTVGSMSAVARDHRGTGDSDVDFSNTRLLDCGNEGLLLPHQLRRARADSCISESVMTEQTGDRSYSGSDDDEDSGSVSSGFSSAATTITTATAVTGTTGTAVTTGSEVLGSEDGGKTVRLKKVRREKVSRSTVRPRGALNMIGNSSIHSLFAGQMNSCLKCQNCKHSNSKSELFLDICLSIANVRMKPKERSTSIVNETVTVDESALLSEELGSLPKSTDKDVTNGKQAVLLADCLREYTAEELLTGFVVCIFYCFQYPSLKASFCAQKCETCDAYTPTCKQLLISKPPKILIVQLKRFDYMKQEKVRICWGVSE
jgi:nitrate reductase NapAB chaperone NapD